MPVLDTSELTDVLAVTFDGWLEDFTPEQVARSAADAFTKRTGRRMLIALPEPAAILTDAELLALERKVAGAWFSAKAVWFAVRPGAPYEHRLAIDLGKQLSARYRLQQKKGPTREYWIASNAIAG